MTDVPAADWSDPVRLRGWALILGASSGFGEAVGLALARAGLDIFGVHLDRKATLPNAERIADGIRALGRQAVFFNVNAADADKRAETATTMQRVLEERGASGTVRVLLHSLAFGTLKLYVAHPMKDAVSPAQMDMTVDVMAHSLVYWTQELVGRGLMTRGRPDLRDDLRWRHARSSELRPGLGGQGGAGVAHPPARRRAGAPGDHRQRHPRGRDRHTGGPEDPRVRGRLPPRRAGGTRKGA